MMCLKDETDKKPSRSINRTEQQEEDGNKQLSTKKKQEKWRLPIDSVNILDIRQMSDDKEHNQARSDTIELIGTDAKSNRFKKAGENMQHLKSSLMKIGMDVRQEKVLLEDDSKYDSAKFRRPKEGTKPRLGSSRPEVINDKRLNVFNARTRDAGISASWTRFNHGESFEASTS